MNIKQTMKNAARGLATSWYMIYKQRDNVLTAAEDFVRACDDEHSLSTQNSAYKQLAKEVRKLRALEGD